MKAPARTRPERSLQHGSQPALDAILRPRSVAVIGAGREPESMSGRLFRNLLATFNGPVYPVNPKAGSIESVRAYASVLDIPGPVDLAFIAVPSACALRVIEQCSRKGVCGLVVISAGFAEVGQQAGQQELLKAIRASGMRMVGPNCVGVVNNDPAVQLNGTFSPVCPQPGNVGVCTQSGALGVVIPDYVRRSGIGASSLVSVGNKADLGENDCLEFWEHDPATDAMMLYLESFQDPIALLPAAQRIARSKPIVALKGGRTAAGARAAGSHTAALATPHAAAEALFRQSGMIRVDALEELFEVTALVAAQPIPGGRRVAVLTNAGGPGVLCADVLESEGLCLPELSTELQTALRGIAGPVASVRNPIDLIAAVDPHEYRRCLQHLLRSDEIDSVIVIYVPRTTGSGPAILQAVRETAAVEPTKTVLTVFMQTDGLEDRPTKGHVAPPNFLFPEAAARALSKAVHYGQWLQTPAGRAPAFDDVQVEAASQIIERAFARLGKHGGWLEPGEALGVLSAFGLPLAAWKVARTAEEAIAAARTLDGPVAVKVISPSALHKSDRGGVALNVAGDEAVRKAFARVTAPFTDVQGVLVQQYVPHGHEALVGVTRDPQFGPLIAFGLGGVQAELTGDVTLRMYPLTDRDAAEMIGEIRSARLLDGYRNAPPVDKAALEELLLRVSTLAGALPEVAELDLNPVKLLAPGQGACVVDCRIRIARNGG
ncbi:MAG TPA: acetate--CoA ligase family protein [Pirellulales bacterium]|nr:acetate--CoA ligase family protein [Pirellulales bacterium]